MNLKFWNVKPSIYDEPIEKVLTEMNTYGPDSEEFESNLTYLERLSRMKNESKNIMRVSPDTWVVSAASVLGVLIIVAYEQSHPMVSKGLGERIKPKL